MACRDETGLHCLGPGSFSCSHGPGRLHGRALCCLCLGQAHCFRVGRNVPSTADPLGGDGGSAFPSVLAGFFGFHTMNPKSAVIRLKCCLRPGGRVGLRDPSPSSAPPACALLGAWPCWALCSPALSTFSWVSWLHAVSHGPSSTQAAPPTAPSWCCPRPSWVLTPVPRWVDWQSAASLCPPVAWQGWGLSLSLSWPVFPQPTSLRAATVMLRPSPGPCPVHTAQ